MSKKVFLFVLACASLMTSIAQTGKNPSFEEVISLQSNSNAVISPDGKHIVFEKQSVDWKGNKFDRELWLSKNGNTPFQLTNNTEGNSRNPKWSPDGEWIAFSSKRGEKTQIHVIRVMGGEASQLTRTEMNISNFEWSPDGKKIAFLQSEDNSKEEKKRKDKFGGFAVEDAEFNLNQIWVLDFNPAKLHHFPSPEQLKDSLFKKKHEAKPLLDSTSFSVNNFKWSPDGKKMAIEHQPNPLINTFFEADISIYDIETKSIQSLVKNPSNDGLVDLSLIHI